MLQALNKVGYLTALFAGLAIAVYGWALYARRTSKPLTVADEAHTVSSPAVFRAANVHDGDTLNVIGADRILITVRLAGIDAPELGQESGFESKQMLQDLVSDRKLSLKNTHKDKFGRYLADVFYEDVWVNKILVERGCAWVYRNKQTEPDLIRAEERAKSAKLGLWHASNPISPWLWRAQQK